MKVKYFISSLLSVIIATSAFHGLYISASHVYNSRYDVNNDNVIDLTDISYMAMYLNGYLSPSNPYRFDINQNGLISNVDLDMLRDYYVS